MCPLSKGIQAEGRSEGRRPREEMLDDAHRKGGKLKNSWYRLPWPLSTRSRDDDVPPIHRATTLLHHSSSYLFSIRFSNRWIFIISSPSQIVSRKLLACLRVYARARQKEERVRGRKWRKYSRFARARFEYFPRRQELMHVSYLTIFRRGIFLHRIRNSTDFTRV